MNRSPARARLRAAVVASFTNRFEPLESRVLLCSSPAELAAIGVPASIVQDDGHIRYSDFVNLTPQQQAHINPHLIESPIGSSPIDFDKILGVPLSATRGQNAPAPVVALPDFFPSIADGPSMDLTSQAGRALLRFGTQVNNMGAGPGTFISGRPGVDPIPSGAPITSWLASDGSQNVLQAVYTYDSATNAFALDHYNASGHFTYHAGHGHFHFDGYADYSLRYRNTDGTVGDYVQRTDGTGVVGAKTGFCLINVNGSFILPNGQSSTTLPGYNGTGQPSTGCGFLQGVNVGRADVYSSGLAGQWIDVTGVPAGQYFLEIKLDGENAMIEGDENNNAKTFLVNISGNGTSGGIQPDQFDANNQHNDTLATATDMGVMGTMTQTGLTIHWGLDEDYFKFTASSSGSYTVSTTAANGDVNLYLYDANGTQIAASTNPSGTDTVTYSFVRGQTYFAEAQCYNSSTSSNYQIAWTLKPTVDSIAPARTVVEENSAGSYFTIARNGPTTSPLTVTLAYSGNAVSGVDYQAMPTTVVLDVLSSSINVPLIPIDNNHIDPKRSVIVTVQSNNAYVVGVGTASITIIDQDTSRSTAGDQGTRLGTPAASGASLLRAFNTSRGILADAAAKDSLFGDDRLSLL
jgi:hypothetical protein